MNYADTTVIIPTLNEAKSVGELIKIIKSSYKGITIIVADDGSGDGTKEIVRKLDAKLLDRTNASVHGLTASVVDAAKTAETRFIIVIDGDLQHPPEKIREIAAMLREGNDVVIGTRAKVAGKWPLQRKIMSAAATGLARIRLMRNIKDPMSGYFGIKAELFKEKRFEEKGYKVLFDLLKQLPNARIANVYYTFGERAAGKSKIGGKQIISFLKAIFS
ncbi:glycosyltransferase [Candidatus Woesearchaeota archaeon]|nr:glycosyltransferase [Candidatus Woesearchaeota archaeon]